MDKWNRMLRWPRWLKAMQVRAWSSRDHLSHGIWRLAVGAGALVVTGSLTGVGPACPGAGTVAGESKISTTTGGFQGDLDPGDLFGRSAADIGDLDGDGVSDLAVGAYFDDDGGTNTGAVWLLELNDCGPTITQQPGSVLLPISGGMATFTVAGAGEEPLSYQWFRDNEMLTDGPDIAGSTTPQLTVDAADDDIALYTVMISNSFETVVSRTAVLGIRQSCAADTDDDGVVGINDFLALLAAWGACP